MKKSDLYGILGSAIFCGIVLLLLFLIVMPGTKTPEDEGIIVSFGNSFEGGGQSPATSVTAPQPVQPAQAPSQPAQQTPQPQQASEQELMTQEDNSLEIARQKEERKKKEQEELERKKREEEERRLAEEKRQEEERRLAEEKRLEEQRRREQEAIEKANALGNMFGTGESTEGSGSNTGESQQGNPVGKGSSEGNSWSLDGRALIGKLVTPNYNRNVEGKITVSIRVDENGNVTSASIGTPTTISDAETRNATLEAARKTKFSAGQNISTGTITYNFKLR